MHHKGWTRNSEFVARHTGVRRNCVSAAVTSGSWVSLNSDHRLLRRADVLLLDAKETAGEWFLGL